ncbi:MAG TPA: hypothetical protein VH593_26460 [Ktedonobacteraceae bacterium]|jgi:transcriptional regulator with XRE-family HTH domain
MSTNQPTLQDLRKRRFKTVKAFAEALNITPYQATSFLRCQDGGELWFKREEEILALLGITFDEYYAARDATQEYEQKRWRELHPPIMTPEQWEASIKEVADAAYARMTPEQNRLRIPLAFSYGVKQAFLLERRGQGDT